MTAGALTYLFDGSPEQVGHASSLALQGLLGLVCDPIAGLVEVPCVMRNATGASVALAGAELALAGVRFPVPFDEVVGAAARVGASLPPSLRETAQGGLAQTPTGRAFAKHLRQQNAGGGDTNTVTDTNTAVGTSAGNNGRPRPPLTN
jgi:L-serine dehydratase